MGRHRYKQTKLHLFYQFQKLGSHGLMSNKRCFTLQTVTDFREGSALSAIKMIDYLTFKFCS